MEDSIDLALLLPRSQRVILRCADHGAGTTMTLWRLVLAEERKLQAGSPRLRNSASMHPAPKRSATDYHAHTEGLPLTRPPQLVDPGAPQGSQGGRQPQSHGRSARPSKPSPTTPPGPPPISVMPPTSIVETPPILGRRYV